MSKLLFQGALTLLSATPSTGRRWTIFINFRDNEGVFSATQIEAGDLIILDTGYFEPGSLTRYEVVAVEVAEWSGQAQLLVECLPDNNSVVNPPLQWLSGGVGVISRPSPQHGLIPAPACDIQRIPDRFSHFIYNYNNRWIVDNLDAGGIKTFAELNVGIISIERELDGEGSIVLPSQPYGMAVFNMGRLKLHDGRVVELDRVRVYKDGDQHKAQLPPEVFAEYEGLVDVMAVSYLGDLNLDRIAFASIFHTDELPGFGYGQAGEGKTTVEDFFDYFTLDGFGYNAERGEPVTY